MQAFSNVTERVFRLTRERLEEGFRASRASERQRIILPIHRRQDASVQRMLNFLQPETYVQAHAHPLPGQIELVSVLAGRIGLLIFDAEGEVTEHHELHADPTGVIDIAEGTWHALICLEPDTAILEAKQGPYDPRNDKTFAPWSPAEGEVGASEQLRAWKSLFKG